MASNWSLNQVLAQLDSGRKWSGSTITYAFPALASGLFSQGEAAGFRAVNPVQQSLITLALATWDELIPQGFAPGAVGSSHIEVGYTSTSIGYAHAYFPTNGSIYFNATEGSLVQTAVGEYGFQTFIHEIGHALGLNHMGDYNGDGNWSPSSYQDSVVLSVMSYFGPRNAAPNYSAEVMQADWVGPDGRIHSPQTPMVNDVLAIQTIYGLSSVTRTGNTVYGFNANAGGPTGNLYDFIVNPQPVLTLFDSGGFDTLDLSGWISPSRVDLRAGAYSSANEMTNNIAIAYNTVIEAAVGGGGNDEITGNAAGNRLVGNGGSDSLNGLDGDDVLDGGPGNDQLDGGAGDDTAIFAGAFSAYSISVTGNSVTLTSTVGGSDRAVGIERFQFADVTRTLAELAGGGPVDTTAPLVRTLSPADSSAAVARRRQPVDRLRRADQDRQRCDRHLQRRWLGLPPHRRRRRDPGRCRRQYRDDRSGRRSAGWDAPTQVGWDPGAFADLAGNRAAALSDSTAWNFATVSTDARAPATLLSLSPADDGSNVAAGANLVLRFDEAVVAGSGNITIRSGAQVLRSIAVGDTSQVQIAGGIVTVDPAVDLPAGSAISVTVDAGALRDGAGNAYAGWSSTTAWNFGTAAAVSDDFPYSADTPGVVNVGGQATSGRIEIGGDRDLFRVVLSAGQTYSFTLERSAGGLTDPYLTLWNEGLQLLAQDDDSAGTGNARIGYTPTTSGTYYLGVQDYSSTGSGAYSLRASVADVQPPTLATLAPADGAVQVAVGADLVLTFSEPVVAGVGAIRLLNAEGSLLREIRASDTGAVRISGSTVTIDPGANLPAGTAFTVNVDAGSFRDAAGNAFAGIGGNAAWNFSTAAVSGADDFPMSVSTAGVVAVNGTPIGGRIDYADDGDLFRVALTAGVTYRFDLVSSLGSPVDPYLMLFGTLPEVDLIGYDDDGGPRPLDSQLFFTPSESGTYFLAAFDYAEGMGRYTLSARTPSDDHLGSTATQRPGGGRRQRGLRPHRGAE